MPAESKAFVQVKKAGHQKARRSARQRQRLQAGFYTSSFSLTERRGLQTARGLVLAEMTGQGTNAEA
jgi:hypothetical protein